MYVSKDNTTGLFTGVSYEIWDEVKSAHHASMGETLMYVDVEPVATNAPVLQPEPAIPPVVAGVSSESESEASALVDIYAWTPIPTDMAIPPEFAVPPTAEELFAADQDTADRDLFITAELLTDDIQLAADPLKVTELNTYRQGLIDVALDVFPPTQVLPPRPSFVTGTGTIAAFVSKE